MNRTASKKVESLHNVLRRLREASGLTMRQAGGMLGISHVTISHYENGRLDVPEYRIEQLLSAYGYTKEDFQKIMGCSPVRDLKQECVSMLDQLSLEQIGVIHAVMKQFLHSVSDLCIPRPSNPEQVKEVGNV